MPSSEGRQFERLCNFKLPSLTILMDALSLASPSDFQEVSETYAGQYRFNIKGCNYIHDEEFEYVNTTFQSLLASTPVNAQKLAEFFQQTLHLDQPFPPEEIQKLGVCFEANKSQLAFLFSQDGGFDRFVSRLGSLGHGCVANLASHLSMVLTEALIDDPMMARLYMIYQKITSLSHFSIKLEKLLEGRQKEILLIS